MLIALFPMKTSLFSALKCLLLASLAPAADLIVEPKVLTPKSTLELRFDTPMVDKSRVGTVEKNSPLVAKPDVEGEFKWTSSRSGQFHFVKPPTFGTKYHFALRAGLQDAAGKAVDAQEFDELETESFRSLVEWHDYPYNYTGVQQRVPYYIIQFSDAVDSTEAAKQIYFTTPNGHEKITATARLATGKDFKHRYETEVAPTWEERTTGVKPILKDNEARPNAIVVQSTEPLPVGEKWTLVIPKTFGNLARTANLGADRQVVWGNVIRLAVAKTYAEPHFDAPHSIEIEFNKSLVFSNEETAVAVKRLTPLVKVEPAVPNMELSVSYNRISIAGDFELEKSYSVTISDGIPASDELGLEKVVKETVIFHPSQAFVSTSAFQNKQLSGGKGIFDIYAANFKAVHVRVKKLSDGDLVKARQLYADSYETYDDGKGSQLKKLKESPFEKYPGTVIYDKSIANTKPLEKASRLDLNWRDVLGQTPSAPLFIELEATPQEGAPVGNVLNRAIVEFTDIGLLVKNSGKEALVYAFSLRSGEPAPEVELTFMDKERGFVRSAKSDAKGMVTVASDNVAWVLAKKGEDCTAINCGNQEGHISMWRHGISYAWNSPWKKHLETFMFADRPVYKPGETAHVKAITRSRVGDELDIDAKPVTANLTVTDPRGRTILTKNVTFTANGTWADDITFPETLTGAYSVNLTYPKAKVSAVADETEDDEAHNNRADFGTISLRVDDYKPNTFEVAVEGSKFKMEKDRITVPMHARYYMGKSLSSAKMVWNAGIEQSYSPPQAFAEYSFGDSPRWWHYGEDRDDETASEESHEKEWGAHGEMELAADGTATIELPPPAPHKASLPQTITVFADVTDVNQQTIAASTRFEIPGADFLLGVKKNHWYGSAEKPMDFDLVTITPEGKLFGAPVNVDIKIERQEWNTVRVEAAGGGVTTKNQSVITEELKTSLKIGASQSSTNFAFTPKKGGTYFLTATSQDAQGHKLFTRVPFYVLGGGGYPWAWEDGEKLTLQPDKTKVKPGEEVSVVVKSPISGTALVTVERNHIHRQFLAPITPENPVVKIAMTEEDAPNAFVSVTVIRGFANSPQPDPMPEYKVGYCNIEVQSNSKRLFVDAKPSQDTIKPGQELTVSATVKDSAGKAVEASEVTLYAVDEGVLSLMTYETPKPFEFFHSEMPLAVNSYTSLESLLQESDDKRYRGNKGIVVGGGGDEAGADAALRKNFVATALWSASLVTDKNGRISATFKVPDSLTRYRIMAIAVKGGDRFGTSESSFTVNKPLMIEPVVPRFAHLSDEILVKAVLHNTTAHSGEVEVELKLDDTATLISEQRPFALVAFKNRTLTNDGKVDRRTVTLKAGETTALAFPVRFVKTGTCAWQWRVSTSKWSDSKALVDAVESKFEVTQPAPALREVHYFQLARATSNDDLLKKINPQLLEADGDLRLDFNQSRMGEARDALEHLLHYPYGCVEQTTSSMLPWLALSKYEPLFPDLLQKDKVNTAIKRGVARILTMQTEEGGLAYWPGGTKPLLWASAYGGYGLIKAKEWGIPVPQETIDKITKWMSEELRGLDLGKTDESYSLYDSTFALYMLAKAGKAEPAYQNLLYQRRNKMPETSRLFLAMAMAITKAPEKQITELMKPLPATSRYERYWLGDNTANGLRLLLCAELGLTNEGNKLAGEIFDRRGRDGHWGTTFSNAWILLGISANERTSKDASPLNFVMDYGGKKSEMTLASPLATTSALMSFDHQGGAKPLHVSVPDGKTLRGRVELKAWPDMKTFQPVQKGFGIKRRYERLTSTGTLEPAKDLRVGDLIVVTLEVEVLRPNRYLALEDPLPSVFEPVNPEFATQNQRNDAKARDNEWMCDYRELRNDKALFFTDNWSQLGRFDLKYLARVIAEGDVIAPPTRIEAMYEPDHYGLGSIDRVLTLPMANGGNVADK